MTPDLIAQVLAVPLPVRLALLDAGPNAPGWWVRQGYPDIVPVPARAIVQGNAGSASNYLHIGDAWLPCNPRAIERHAQKLYHARLVSLPPCDVVVRSDGAVFSRLPEGVMELQYRYHRALQIAVTPDLGGTGERDYMNAIALLREVVG